MTHTTSSTRSAFGPAASPTRQALMGLRFWEGEEGGGGGNPPTPTPPAPTPMPTPPAPAPQPTPTPSPAPAGKTYSEDYVKEVREEAKQRREAAKAAEQRAEAAERERDALRAQVAEATRRDAVRTLAAKPEVGGNADMLLDSRAFETATKDLDWSDAGKVQAAITEFVKAHPAYAAAPQRPGSSGPARPGGGTPPPSRPRTLGAAVGAALGAGN